MTKPPTLSRRSLLALAARNAPALAVAALVAHPLLRLGAQTLAGHELFALGVASGCPTPDGVVLWTRLAPEPLAEDGGIGGAAFEVQWELAEDDAFNRIVRTGSEMATAQDAHSVHVELRGLAPARDYWYRFSAAGARSAAGRTRTAPAVDDTRPVRFAFASCQQYEQGHYGAYRDMAKQPLDLVVHLGDYIYESSWGRDHVRHHTSGVPTDLLEYRARYALYKSDADLQAAHAAFPWLVIWDDHEVANDYTSEISPMMSDPAQFRQTRAAAYRAWWEHMPVPRRMRPVGPDARIYDRWRFGCQLDIFMLDGRQHRDHHVCLYSRNASPPVDCPDRLDPQRSLLGTIQETWFERELAKPATAWTVVAQPTLMASVDRAREGEPSGYWMDGWDGYAATRQRVLDALAAHRPRNPLVISGDVHAFWAADLARTPGAVPMATEFVGGAITSQGPSAATVKRLLARNPELRYGRGDRRGYAVVALDEGSAQVSYRAVDDVKDANTAASTLARFVVQSGRAGVIEA